MGSVRRGGLWEKKKGTLHLGKRKLSVRAGELNPCLQGEGNIFSVLTKRVLGSQTGKKEGCAAQKNRELKIRLIAETNHHGSVLQQLQSADECACSVERQLHNLFCPDREKGKINNSWKRKQRKTKNFKGMPWQWQGTGEGKNKL